MHYPHYYRVGFFRGPSRLFWFLLGSGTTFWWLKHREAKGHISPICARYKLQPPTTDDHQSPGWPQSMASIPRAINNIPTSNTPTEPSSQTPMTTPSNWKWDPDREHLEKISRQAVDAMTELTESTLESVLSTAEALKAKLAEHRAQREKQQQEIDSQLEEQHKNPPRLV